MFTYVARCTGNLIKVPSVSGPTEVLLPVIIAKQKTSFLFPMMVSLPDIPEKIRKINLSVEGAEFKAGRSVVFFDIEFLGDIYYVYNNIVKYISHSEIFSGSMNIPQSVPDMEVIHYIDTFLTYDIFRADLSMQIIVDICIRLLEFRNINI